MYTIGINKKIKFLKNFPFFSTTLVLANLKITNKNITFKVIGIVLSIAKLNTRRTSKTNIMNIKNMIKASNLLLTIVAMTMRL
jgi:hypothetical protein